MRMRTRTAQSREHQEAFYVLFKAMRKKAKLTQNELAKKIRTSQSEISKIENGIAMPGLFTWVVFCEEFKKYNADLDKLNQHLINSIKESP